MTKQNARSTDVDLIVSISTGRSISDDYWEEIDAGHMETWKRATTLFRTREYKSDDSTIHLSFDWSPVLTRMRRAYRVMERIFDPAVSNAEKKAIRFPRQRVRVKCKATVTKDLSEHDAAHAALSHAESYLYDLFLILNLAAPGCCSFWNGGIAPLKPTPISRFWSSRLLLSEYEFDNAYLSAHSGGWPAPKLMDLESVAHWYQVVRKGVNQVPESRAQKVLFGLMHISKGEKTLDQIMWLFYALETLYDTTPGENRRALTNRMSLVLGADDKQRKHIKTELSTLYDIRSGFAHGGREIVHPMNNEALDRRAEGKFRELMEASEFGFTVLLCSLQTLIERGWSEFKFHETLTGQPLPNTGGEVIHFPLRESRSS